MDSETDKTLTIGTPTGSMIDPKRGGLLDLLNRARLFSENLEGNAPASFPYIPWLKVFVARPQELPGLAAQGYCDIFFCGDDWATEWKLRGKESLKMLGLATGKVDIVYAANRDLRAQSVVKVATEYPFIAENYMRNFLGVEQDYPVVKLRAGDDMPTLDRGIIIIDSYGATEAKAFYGLADAVVENTQSGTTLKNFKLDQRTRLFTSESSLYQTVNLKTDEWKMRKAYRISTMLKAAIDAEGVDLVTFNVPNTRLKQVLEYVRTNGLFGSEETLKQGQNWTEFTLQLRTKYPRMPLIDVVGELSEMGATCIDGIPLAYSAKGRPSNGLHQ